MEGQKHIFMARRGNQLPGREELFKRKMGGVSQKGRWRVESLPQEGGKTSFSTTKAESGVRRGGGGDGGEYYQKSIFVLGEGDNRKRISEWGEGTLQTASAMKERCLSAGKVMKGRYASAGGGVFRFFSHSKSLCPLGGGRTSPGLEGSKDRKKGGNTNGRGINFEGSHPEKFYVG